MPTCTTGTRVVFGKLFAVLGLGFLLWLVSRALSFTAGLLFFHNIGLTNSLTEWPVQRAIIFNLVAYLLWALFGFGLGTLIHSQIGAVVTAMVIYLVGFEGGRMPRARPRSRSLSPTMAPYHR